MAISVADAFKKLRVEHGASESEHEHVFEVSFEYLLKISNYSDTEAFKNCLVALINLDKYHRAYEVAKRVPKSVEPDLLLELAYIYYKLGKLDLVAPLYAQVKSLPDGDGVKVGMQHIMAQTWYKSGDYIHALEEYHLIIANTNYDSQEDLAVNERAIVSQLDHQPLLSGTTATYNTRNYQNNYDLLFNEALVDLSRGLNDKAKERLTRALDVCIVLNSDALERELMAELAPIKLTLAYVFLQDGQTDEYLEITNTINEQLIDDAVTKLIVKNNWYAMQAEKANCNINLINRDLQLMHILHLQAQKLTRLQFQQIFKNSMALRYAAGTLGPKQVSHRFSAKYSNEFVGDLLPLVYRTLIKLDIGYEQLQDPGQYDMLSRKVYKHAKLLTVCDDHIAAALLLVKLNEKNGKYDHSLQILQQLFNESISAKRKIIPALFECLHKIYNIVGRPNRARDILGQAMQLLVDQRNVLSSDLAYFNFAKFVAFESYRQETFPESTEALFALLAEIDQNDVLVNAVRTQSVDGLTPVEKLVDASSVSIDELLETSVESVGKMPNDARPRQHVNTTRSKVKKPKHKRPARFSVSKVMKPADQVTVDEERWLPLKLRSYYKPTKKDKKKVSTHQGAMEPIPAKAAAPIVNTSGGASKKKKKKGKK